MEVYILYEMFYGKQLQDTSDSATILGVYKNIDEAIKNAEKLIQSDIDTGYVLDEDRQKIVSNAYYEWRLFWEKQENWNDYFEVVIEKKEVE